MSSLCIEYYLSRCSICGKLGDFKYDDGILKKFPNAKSFLLFDFLYSNEDCVKFREWCFKNYQIFEVDDFDIFKDKYI